MRPAQIIDLLNTKDVKEIEVQAQCDDVTHKWSNVMRQNGITQHISYEKFLDLVRKDNVTVHHPLYYNIKE
jgi:hypothetical protein